MRLITPTWNRRQEIALLQDELTKLLAERLQLRTALQSIWDYPLHSEPVGGAMAMKEIALAALSK